MAALAAACAPALAAARTHYCVLHLGPRPGDCVVKLHSRHPAHAPAGARARHARHLQVRTRAAAHTSVAAGLRERARACMRLSAKRARAACLSMRCCTLWPSSLTCVHATGLLMLSAHTCACAAVRHSGLSVTPATSAGVSGQLQRSCCWPTRCARCSFASW